jgi:hypothetical protein
VRPGSAADYRKLARRLRPHGIARAQSAGGRCSRGPTERAPPARLRYRSGDLNTRGYTSWDGAKAWAPAQQAGSGILGNGGSRRWSLRLLYNSRDELQILKSSEPALAALMAISAVSASRIGYIRRDPLQHIDADASEGEALYYITLRLF